MSKGFLTLAQNTFNVDYVKLAYALAMSLKLSQSKNDKLTVVVNKNEEIPKKYIDVFDKVIYTSIPENDWKIQNKWRYFWYTPYDETIVLDCDMLFFNDISTWWDCLENKELEFATHTYNYRGKVTTSDYYRKTFISNDLPNLHTALFYFKKTEVVYEFFKFLKILFENWVEFYDKFLEGAPKFLSGDVAYALAAKIFFNRKWNSFLTFTHMRSRLQDNEIVRDWHKQLVSFFTNYHGKIELKINNFNQIYPFHYIKKDFLTNEVIELYEDTIRLL
jgi:hypothetical protein